MTTVVDKTALQIFIPGVVRGQGSLTLWRGPDGTERAKHPQSTIAWRNTMIDQLGKWWEGKPPLREAVRVDVIATFARPQGHLGTGRNAGTLRGSAPIWKTGSPDLDKVIRGVGDALTYAGVIVDDSLIAKWTASAFWAAPDGRPGALIVVRSL
jgi:Holliday junction resolvase RusA-like endonuclease